MAGNFAELVVNFTTTGFQAVSTQLTTLQASLTTFAGVGQTASQQLAGAGAAITGTFMRVSAGVGGAIAGMGQSGVTAGRNLVAGFQAAGRGIALAFNDPKAALAAVDLAAGQLATRVATRLAGSFTAPFRGLAQLGQGLTQTLQGAAAAVNPLTMAVSGFAMAGFRASFYGQMFGYQMEEISRQVGSIFLPVFQRVTDTLGQVMRWFQGLTGAQQRNLREWGLLAAGITAAALTIPRVVSGFQAITMAVRGVGMALTGVSLANPWLLLVAGLGAAIASTMTLQEATQAFTDVSKLIADPFRDLLALIKDIGQELRNGANWARGLAESVAGMKNKGDGGGGMLQWLGRGVNVMANTQALNEKLHGEAYSKSIFGRLSGISMAPLATGMRLFGTGLDDTKAIKGRAAAGEEARGDLLPKVGQFESVEATYRRITEASIKSTGDVKDPATESRDYLKEIMETVARLDATARGIKPGVV